MNRRQISYSILVSLALMFLSILFFDQPIAAFVQRVEGKSSVILQQGTLFLEVISGFPITKFALSFALLAAGLILSFWNSTRAAAWMFLFIGCAQFVTRIAAGTLKNVFTRLRPFEVIEAGNWDWNFFGDRGSSFPSGHAAHFWGLFFPLAFLFPRYRIPFLIIPIFIFIARVGVNDHWCSDVLGSVAISAAITLFFIWLFRMKPAQAGDSSTITAQKETSEAHQS